MSFYQELENKTRAAYPCLYITAREDWRCLREIQKVAESLNLAFSYWTVLTGWTHSRSKGASSKPSVSTEPQTDPLDAIKSLATRDEGIYAFVNFHRFLDDPQMIQAIKDHAQKGKSGGQTAIFVCNVQKVPPELQDDVSMMEFGLPDAPLIQERIRYVYGGMKDRLAEPDEALTSRLVDAALGMTTLEAENALTLAIVEKGAFDPQIVSREKAKAVAKGGFLEYYRPLPQGMKEVGGLENLKTWLMQRKGVFSKEARDFGLPDPKGILLVGVPGCGKSLSAKAVATEWGIPLLRFDLGRLFQGLVGASEANTRSAIQTAEAVAPCVLWIDEIEKGMAGVGGSGQTDSGVSARVFGNIIVWMQERTRPVFVVATANAVLSLPPELLRAGRFDEVFYVDLPSLRERIMILSIHLKKRKREVENYNLTVVAEATRLFSGAELESVVVKGLFLAFSQQRELNTQDLLDATKATVPLAVTRREEIQALRTWAETRALNASREQVEAVEGVEARRRVIT